MLDGLLGRGFAPKCKSQIKLTKSRIDAIRRKKKATLKFLKKDIAELLTNGLDINAYGRAEGLLAELIILSCYDFVEQSCDTVLTHLPIMQKQRECPEECREAIASLMFAAARFSDLPELRELRQIFQERFETSLEHLENQKFVENLASKPSTLEKKVQLLKDIAMEFSVKWDSVGFEKRMSTPPTNAQGPPKRDFGSSNAAAKRGSSHVKEVDPRVGKDGASHKESFEHANGEHRFTNPIDSTISGRKERQFQPRQELPGNGHERVHDKEESILKLGHINHFGEKKGSTVRKHEARNEIVGSALRTGRMVGSSSSSEVLGDDGPIVHKGRERTVPDYLKLDGHMNHFGEKKGSTVSKHEARNGLAGSAPRTGRTGSSSSSEVLGDDGPIVHNGRERTVPDYLKLDGHINHFGEKKGGSTVSKHEARNGLVGSAPRTGRMGSSSSSEVLGDDGPIVHHGRERTVPDYLKFSPHNNPGLPPSGAGLQFKSDIKEPSSGNSHTGRNGGGLVLKNNVKESSSGNNNTGRNGHLDLSGKAEEDRLHNLKPSFKSPLPPPYVKANSRRKDYNDGGHSELSRTGNDNNCISADPHKHVRSEMTAGVIQLEPRRSDHERQITSPMRENSRAEMDHVFGAGLPPDALPKPRSVRRRHHKPRSSPSVDNAEEEIKTVRKKSRSSRRRDDKRGLQLLVDEEEKEGDEEEMIMDKLLMHYSKKPSTFEPGKMRRKPKNHLAMANGSNAAESHLNLGRDGADGHAGTPPPARSVSLPRQHLGPSEATKVFARAASFQPDRSNAAKHVHPKLPDYDDLAAQFAALRGR